MLKELKSKIVANDEWSFLCQDQNVFDSKKKVKLTNAEGVEFKLSKKQLQAIEFNKALLDSLYYHCKHLFAYIFVCVCLYIFSHQDKGLCPENDQTMNPSQLY